MAVKSGSSNRYVFVTVTVCVLCFISLSLICNQYSFNVKQNDVTSHNIEPFIILAFGDSLTKGFFRNKGVPSFQPYALSLSELITKFSTDKKIILKKSGVVGQCVADMKSRLNKNLN